MSETATAMQERPALDGYTSWPAYWKARGMPWRTEPEIDEERREFLAEQRETELDIKKGIYPFKDIKLDRADIEWLLATHESGDKVGPVWWEEEEDKPENERHEGLNLCGADLRGADLHDLPLSCLRGSMSGWDYKSVPQIAVVPLLLQRARLDRAQLQGAALAHSQLHEANLERAQLQRATLRKAHLQGAVLAGAQLQRADCLKVESQGAIFVGAQLQGAMLSGAHLQGANFLAANLQGADLLGAHLQGTVLHGAQLQGADMTSAHMDVDTAVGLAAFDDKTCVADVVWNNAPLTRVAWDRVPLVGDESRAKQRRSSYGTVKDRSTRLEEFKTAVRANRQLATALRSQALNADANRFAYKAQVLERQVLRRQRRYLSVLGSLLLDLISGHGYKPMRSLIAYAVIICAFAGAYLLNAQFAAPHLTWDEALVLSISSFHGRGFFTTGISLSDTLARLAAGEAIVGLLIEITFIATFTQRFFAR